MTSAQRQLLDPRLTDTRPSSTSEGIAYLNSVYIRTLKDVAQRSIPEACVRFGVTPDVASAICEMGIPDMENLSRTSEVMFRASLTLDDIRSIQAAAPNLRAVISGLANAKRDLGL